MSETDPQEKIYRFVRVFETRYNLKIGLSLNR